MIEYIQVTTSVDNEDDAKNIASVLVSQRLAAGVQVIGPMVSTYWWNNDVHENTEWLCLIKTRADLYPEVEAMIAQIHPYDVPEILAMPVVAGGHKYLAWLDGETKSPNGKAAGGNGQPSAEPAPADAPVSANPSSTSAQAEK